MMTVKRTMYLFFTLFLFCGSLVWSDVDVVYISGGSFNRKISDGSYQVVILSPFLMSKYEITVQKWSMYLESTGADVESWWNSLVASLDDWSLKEVNSRWPTWNISWIQAVEYCNWLSMQEGYGPCYTIEKDSVLEYRVTINKEADGYRLPTVAEWQMVSGARVVELGNEDVLLQSVLAENNPSRLPSEVGKRLPNTYGVYDIFGSVEEFCWDYYNPDLKQDNEVTNPLGPESFLPDADEVYYKELLHETRITAGGMWGTKVLYLLDNPFRSVVSIEKGFVGIRLVRSVKENR